jgi:hypothetical protein
MTIRVASPRVIGLLLVGGVNVWLLTIIAAVIAPNDSAFLSKAEWKPNLLAYVEGSASRKPIGAYSQILMRPIFFKSREPFVAAPVAPRQMAKAAPPPLVDPGFVIGGVIIKSDVRKVYIFDKSSAGGIWVNEGDDLMGWKVRSIDGAGAKLEQQGRVIDVQLYPQK